VPRPGVDVDVVEEVTESGPILDTGQGFFVGWTERGPDVGAVNSWGEFKKRFGDSRAANAPLYDDIMGFFSEGAGTAIIARDVPPDATEAEADLAAGLTAFAAGAGAWGNDVDVTTHYAAGSDAAGEPIYLTVTYQGTEVERSKTLSSLDQLVAWSQDSDYVRITADDVSAPLPGDAVVAALAGGGNGTASTLATFQAALGRFTYEMGPGQVGAPGITDPDYHRAIGVHLEANHRCGVVDLPNTADKAELLAARAELDGAPGAKAILAMGQHLVYPSDTPPASNIVPYSGVQMGIIARVDKLGDVAAVAAGSNGISSRALGLAQQFSDADREELNANGVTLGRQMFGQVRTYGYRTAAGPDLRDNWTFFQESRVIMAIAHEANAGLEEYVFDTIDGRLHLLVQAKNMLVGVCQRYWQAGALFGAEAQNAFRVICDSSNNPIDTIKLGEIHATLRLKTSKVAEWVNLAIVKVPTEQEV